MKQILLTFTFIFFLSNLLGQKTELNGALNSGLFSFSGLTARGTTSINWDDRTNSGYTNGVYGSKSALCYGISFNLNRVTKRNFLFGTDLGFETLRSKISIDRIDGYTGNSTYQYSATGKAFLISGCLNFNPFLGYRITSDNISFDLTSGIEVGYRLSSTEKGNATATNGIRYSVSQDYKTIGVDIRPDIKVSAKYKKIGMYSGYTYGLLNYEMWVNGDGRWESYSRLIRFGVTYQIN
jgi:hypothetical protein